jgi:hypothetical protein
VEADLPFDEVRISGIYRRLIPSKFPTIDVYERLGSQALKDEAIRLEALTNPRLISQGRILASADPNDPTTASQLQNWNHAPFTYPNIEGGHFLPRPYPVLELAPDDRAALARAIIRREEFLARTDDPPQGLDMRVISNSVSGTFADLRPISSVLDQQSRWEIGRKLYDGGATGILFGLPEVGGAEFVGIFSKQALIGSAMQAAHYRFQWDGRSIAKVYDFTNGADITREEIFAGLQR